MYIGFTPNNHISKAETIGIHTVYHVNCALRAMLKVGTAISATTAGRMPANMDATHGMCWKFWKNIAMASIISSDGIAVPAAAHIAPRIPRNL